MCVVVPPKFTRLIVKIVACFATVTNPFGVMIRRPPTQLSVQESDVETLKAYRLAKMHQHNPNLTTSSFASLRQDDSHDTYSTHLHPHHYHQHHTHSRPDEDPGTQPGLSQQENQNPNQSNNS